MPRDEYTGGAGARWDVLGVTIVKKAGALNRSIVIGWAGERPTEEEQEANARLMAAAPEMLDALRAALAEEPFVSHETMCKARDAIAAATGEDG